MERIEPPDEIWVDPRLVVVPSAIEGYGLMAIEPIAAGSLVIRLAGTLVTTDELDALIAQNDADPDGYYVDSITVYEDAHLVWPPATTAHFGNHCCDPTMWLTGPYELSARRDIEPGDELTLDYGTISGAGEFSMTCRCHAANCRGEVTSEDWQLPELQARYAGHWAPALADRIAAQRD